MVPGISQEGASSLLPALALPIDSKHSIFFFQVRLLSGVVPECSLYGFHHDDPTLLARM